MKYFMKTVALAFALVLQTLSAQADEATQAIPPQAVGNNTMLALYVDVTQINAEMMKGLGEGLIEGLASAAQMQGEDFALPLGDPQEMIDSLITLRGSFVEAGGEGLTMTAEMPGEANGAPPVSLFAKTNSKLDAPAMEALLRTMGLGETKAVIESLGNGWQNIAIESKPGDAITLALPKPDEAAYRAMNKQLATHKKPVIAMAFRMQEELREMMDEAEDMAKGAQGLEGQEQMMLGMAMGMFQPIRSLDTLGLSISQDGEGILVDAKMTFLDAASAQQFANLYNSMIMFAPVILAGAAPGEVENMPDPATINQFFMMLKMNLDGNTLSLSLDQAFFELAEQLAPLFDGMQGGLEGELNL